MPSLNAWISKPLPWLIGGLLLGVVVSVAVFWGFLALSAWNLTDSERMVHTSAQQALYISSESDSNRESNSQSSHAIDQLLNNLDDFSHLANLYAFLANANESTLLNLLEASKGIASASRRKTAQSAIVQKYVSINPRRAFDRVRAFPLHQQDDLLTNIFSGWSILSLDQAVETASTLDGRLKHLALQTILTTRDDLSDTSRRDIAKRLEGKDFADALLAEERAMSLMANPHEAWDTLVNDGLKNRYRVDAYVQIAVERVSVEGLDVLREIDETLTKDVDEHNYIRDSVVKAVAQANVVETFEYVSTLDQDMQGRLLDPVAQVWAQIDPAAALKAVDELVNNSLTDMIERVIADQWIRSNPRGILPLLSSYSKPVQLLAMEKVATTLIGTAPQEALRLIQEWGNAGFTMTTVARSVIDEWSRLDPKAALQWLLSEESEDWVRYSDMMEKTLRGLASVDPTQAFEVAMKQPLPEQYMSGMEAWVIYELSRTNLEKAVELLPQVRESSRILAYTWTGQALVNVGKPFEALDLAKHLPEDRRESYYFDIAKRWGEQDALHLLETLDSLSTPVIQSNAAKGLMWTSRWDSVLNKSQLEFVRSYLTEEHAEDVERWRNL